MKLSILILFYCIVFHTHTHTHTHRDIYLLAQKFTLPSKLGVVGLNMQRRNICSQSVKFCCCSFFFFFGGGCLNSTAEQYMPLIPALRRQRQADFWIGGQPGLQSEFQDSPGYTEKPCLEKQTNRQTNQAKSNPNFTKDTITNYSCLRLIENIAFPPSNPGSSKYKTK